MVQALLTVLKATGWGVKMILVLSLKFLIAVVKAEPVKSVVYSTNIIVATMTVLWVWLDLTLNFIGLVASFTLMLTGDRSLYDRYIDHYTRLEEKVDIASSDPRLDIKRLFARFVNKGCL